MGRYSIRFVKSDKSRNVVQCGASDQCDYKVRAVWNKEEEKVKVTVVQGDRGLSLGTDHNHLFSLDWLRGRG
jgi:hypothetical protein